MDTPLRPGAQPQPLVSILMPVYQEERFIRSVFEDLLSQTHRNIEILVCDNCSPDATFEIAQEFARRDPRVKAHRHATNIGAVANFVAALELARGEFVMMAAGHDHHLPTYVEACVAELQQDPAVVMAYTKADFMDVAGKVIGRVPTDIDTRGMAPASRVNAVLWGVEYPYQMYGVFRKSLYAGWTFKAVLVPDILFLVHCALQGTFAQVPQALLLMRQNSDYGDAAAYAKKIYTHGTGLTAGSHPDRLYYEMLREYVRVIKNSHPPGTNRNSLVASVVLAMAVRHHCQLDFGRRVAGLPGAPARSDLQSAVDRFAGEFESMLLTRDNVEESLHQKAREDVLKQFATDELVSLMTYRELVRGVLHRIQNTVRRHFSGS